MVHAVMVSALVVGLVVALPPVAPRSDRAMASPLDDAPLREALPLVVTVARTAAEEGDAGGDPAQSAAWIDAQVSEARRLFAPHGLRFAMVESRVMPASFAHLESRRDRDALAARLRPGVVNAFVVASLRDVDEAERMRMGVCWSPLGEPSTRYVIVASNARPSVLAHELGHYFGNPHSRVPNNVMSYERTAGADVFFDAAQGRILRKTARDFLERGVLKAAASPAK